MAQLAIADDVRIAGQAQSPEQLLNTLKEVNPHVLILSTSFLPALSKIQQMLKRRKTAPLVLAEENGRGRLCALVATTRARQSFDGWPRHRGCDAPSSTRRVVCSGSQFRHERRPVQRCIRAEEIPSQAFSKYSLSPIEFHRLPPAIRPASMVRTGVYPPVQLGVSARRVRLDEQF